MSESERGSIIGESIGFSVRFSGVLKPQPVKCDRCQKLRPNLERFDLCKNFRRYVGKK